MLFDEASRRNRDQVLNWQRGQDGRVCGIAELRDRDYPVESVAMSGIVTDWRWSRRQNQNHTQTQTHSWNPLSPQCPNLQTPSIRQGDD